MNLIDRWQELAESYAAVPGRERWEEYTSFIYSNEIELLREYRRMETRCKELEKLG